MTTFPTLTLTFVTVSNTFSYLYTGLTSADSELCPEKVNTILDNKQDTTLKDENKNIPKYQLVTSEFSVMGTGEQSPGEEKEICPARKDGGDIRDDRLVRQIPKTSETGPKGGNEKMCHQKTPEAILKCKYKKTLIQN